MTMLWVLRNGRLARLWGSQVLSAMGDYLYTIAVLWIAVRVAGSQAGLVAAAEMGAALVCGLFGGVCADRWNRRATMIGTDLIRAGVVAVLPILAAHNALQLWHLVLVGALLGGLGSLFDPTLQASLPVMAKNERTLQAANGLMDMTQRLARVLGPSLAGLLVVVLPLSQFFSLDALSFVVSAVAIASLGSRYAWKPARREAAHHSGARGVVTEIAEAVRLTATRPALLWAFLALGVINGLWAVAFTLGVPLLVAKTLHQTVGVYGLIVGAYGVGNVAANLVVGSLPIRRHFAWLYSGKIVLGLGFLLMVSAPSLPLALAGSALAAVGGPMGDVPVLTYIQTHVPTTRLGRTFSLRNTLSNGGALLGTVLAVPWFALVGVRPAIAVCALLMCATGTAGLFVLHSGVRRVNSPSAPLPALPALEPAVAPSGRGQA